jgi:O-antigen ligase
MLLVTAIAATILPPGYSAYIGSYVALAAALLAFVLYGWRDKGAFLHPVSMAIVGAIMLVAVTVPFTYRGEQDLLAPVLILPTLSTIALGILSRSAKWTPDPILFAVICLAASLIAMVGGAYEHFALGVERPGLGNNPIHFSSLAAVAGCLAMIGIVSSSSVWRYVFFLGPVFALGAASVADSRGPTVGAVAMTAVGLILLNIWFWRDLVFRAAVFVFGALAIAVLAYYAGSDSSRISRLTEGAFDIFRITGGPDDIRAALYASALCVLRDSPFFGVGLGQIMVTAETMFPDLVPRYDLDNLHADWANLAATAGSLGLAAYLLLLSAPLLLLLGPEARRDRPIVLGTALLLTGVLTLGISNATFGVLPQTMVYAVVLGYLLGRARALSFAGG